MDIATVKSMKIRVAIVFHSIVERILESDFVALFVKFDFTRTVFIYKQVDVICQMYDVLYYGTVLEKL